MFRLYLKMLVLFAALSSTVGIAADANNPNWQFDVAPYVWALNMSGRVQTGPLKTHISQDFADILRELDGAGMLWLAAHKGPMGVFFNGLFAVLSQSGDVRRIDANMKTRFGILTPALTYIVFQHSYANASMLQLEPYLGVRYTFNHVRLKLDDFTIHNNQNWADPILGLRLRYDFNARWLMQLAADIGGVNRSTQYSYNWAALFGYKPASCSLRHVSFYLGYHYLYQHYETGSGLKLFDWNMRLFGPVLGVNFNF